MTRTKSMVYAPSVESRELFIWADNCQAVYPMLKSVVNCLHKYFVKGRFDADKAADAMFPVMTAAAKEYGKTFGGAFDVTARFTAACDMVAHSMDSIESGI